MALDPQQALKRVLLATIPGVAVLFLFYGWGVLINLVLAGGCALLVDAGVHRLRRQRASDLSSLVSAMLLALALPPYCPWWLCVAAVASALLLGKHLYGGNRNPFNPAMVGYALMLVAFPHPMTHWPATHGLDLLAGLQQVFGLHGHAPDAWAQATALDTLRINKSLTIDELFASSPAFGQWGGRGSEWVNLAYLAGGLWLLRQRVCSWHAPSIGGHISEPGNGWMAAFKGYSHNDPRQFDQMAGATVTSQAVVDAVRDALRYFDEHRALWLEPGRNE